MKHALARLRWRTAESGGRRTPVAGRRYMSPAVFDGTMADDLWTLVVDRPEEAGREEETVLVHFLMDDAPHEALEAGATFQLVEGAQVVAEGQVAEIFELRQAA